MNHSELICSIWGCRGTWPMAGCESVYGLNTSCVSLHNGRELYLFDAGTGLGSLRMTHPELFSGRQVHVFLSHVHLDHVMGITHLSAAGLHYGSLHIYGTVRNGQGIQEQLDRLVGPPYWPVKLSELGTIRPVFHDLMPGVPEQAGSMTVTAAPSCHPNESVWYRLDPAAPTFKGREETTAPDGDTHLCDGVDAALRHGNDGGDNLHQNAAGIPECSAAGFVYGLDCELTPEAVPALTAFAHGAACAVLDAHFAPEDLAAKRGWGHSSYIECIDFAKAAQIRKAVLSHLSPDYGDEKLQTMEAAAAAMDDRAVFAREGMQFPL